MQRPLGFMDPALFRSIVKQGARSTSRIFLHHFGESLLHPALGDCIRYAAEHGVESHLSANPILLNNARIRALVDNGLKEVVLSLDGFTRATSRQVRGEAAEDVDRAEARIKRLIDYRQETRCATPRITMQIVRQRQNVHEIDAWIQKWKNKPGIDRVKVKSYVTWDGSEERINELRIDPEPETSAIVCDKPWSSMTVLWDGRVVPCCFDHDGLLTLGDTTKQSLVHIWRGEPARQLRSCHRLGDFSHASLCARCKDKEGYPVRKWYYPLNRLIGQQSPLKAEWRGAAESMPTQSCATADGQPRQSRT